MAVSESQKKANQKWAEQNKAHRNYLSKRSAARSFIRNNATEEDLKELQALISERLKEKSE